MAYGVNAPFGLRPFSSIQGGAWTEKYNKYNIYTNPTLGTGSYASALFRGDPVVFSPTLANGGTIAVYLPGRASPTPTPAVYSTLPILGVFQGCTYTDTTGNLIRSSFWPGGINVYPGSEILAEVIDDPDVVWDVQVSTPGDVLTNANFPTINATAATYPAFFGRNLALDIGIDTDPNPHVNVFNPTSGSLISGLSAFYAVASSGSTTNPLTADYIKTTATLPFKVLGYTPDVRNKPGVGLTMATTPFLNVIGTINNHAFGHNTAGTTLA